MPPAPDLVAQRFPSLVRHVAGLDVAALVGALEERRLATGDVLLEEGKPSDALYLLWEGELAVVAGEARGPIDLGRVGPGAIVGDVSFLDGGPASATLKADAPATVLALAHAALDDLARRDPKLGTAVLRALCDTLALRIRSATRKVEGVAAQPKRRTGLVEGFRILFGLRAE